MQPPSGVALRLVIILVTVLPLVPSAGDMDLPGRGEQEAPTDQPTRRPPPEGTEGPAEDIAPEPTEQATEAEPDGTPGADATDPFGAIGAEDEAEGAGPVATVLVWGALIAAVGALIWLGSRYLRR